MKRNLVKVRLLVNTAYQGPRKEGDEFFVPEDFANRWVKNKIAELVEGESNDVDETLINENADVQEINDADSQEGDETDDEEEAPVIDETNYDALTAKELYEICKEQGLDVEAKKSKAYYIEKLEEEAAGE